MITVACLLVGPLAGVLGILLAVSAQRRAAQAVAETAALIHGSVGSRGTVDPRALRDLAIVRYDALNEMSGQLSFSVALLNAAGDGVVFSSINGRSETRTYAKVVLGGSGTQALSPEEEQAVRSARLGVGLPEGVSLAGIPGGRDVTISVPGVPDVAPVTPLHGGSLHDGPRHDGSLPDASLPDGSRRDGSRHDGLGPPDGAVREVDEAGRAEGADGVGGFGWLDRSAGREDPDGYGAFWDPRSPDGPDSARPWRAASARSL